MTDRLAIIGALAITVDIRCPCVHITYTILVRSICLGWWWGRGKCEKCGVGVVVADFSPYLGFEYLEALIMAESQFTNCSVNRTDSLGFPLCLFIIASCQAAPYEQIKFSTLRFWRVVHDAHRALFQRFFYVHGAPSNQT